MSEARDLLVEIGTEELPSSELLALGAGFAEAVEVRLSEAGLAHGEIAWFATPRRLTVRVDALAAGQTDSTETHRGPPVSAAFDAAGGPTKAAEGFARRHGVRVEDLEHRTQGKAEYLFFEEHKPGRATAELLPELVAGAARAIPAKKRMRWGVPGVSFPRPVHWAVLLYGEEALEAEILGIPAGRQTFGHRFHHPGPIALAVPEDYAGQLEQTGWVMADVSQRREAIRTQVERVAAEVGGTAELDAELLDEVTSLVEWPVALAGRFDPRFLEVPPEALVAVMKDHQRYFPVRDSEGALLPAFITVSNIASEEPETVRAGNERVIAPRLADAEFFWRQDRRQPLEARREGLRAMVFQRDLGSLHDRGERIAALARQLAGQLGADAGAAERAGRLAKCDLLTEMVGEFPELQGLMGGYYAAADGEPESVALAIADQYRPAFAGDALPRTTEGRALALADRLDALVGIFAVGQGPSGDKDPFASRRAALGALRILIECELDLDLVRALTDAAAGYEASVGAHEAVTTVFDFAMER
ncbi:MAG: glycine--tRNA ligase subunit beta, partial [Halofilum sp. (in: g-proteobacteria)]